MNSNADPLPDNHRVIRQFEAYNDHRLDDFVQCFATTIRLKRGDGEIVEMTILD